jgi:hypothetical protein
MLPSLSVTRVVIILLALFTLSCSNKNAPDLVLINGKVWTGESDSTFQEAVAIKDNKIVAVGKTNDINALADSKTQVIYM